jgi:integrase
MSDRDSTAPARPSKPYPDFPLFPHANGTWAKKIRGKLHYFGPWDDPDAALAKYLERKDALHSGRTPRPDPGALTVKDVANAYLNDRQQAVAVGELSPRTWGDYRAIMEKLVAGLGKERLVSDLAPQDFAALKSKLAKSNGPARMSTIVQVIRCAFKHAYESEQIDRPVRFGPAFKRTSKKVLRLHRAKQGPKMFTAGEVRGLLAAATVPMKAMILLGINCGFGNSDCGNLPLTALDLEGGWVNFPRPKTGIDRRYPLWPETVAAVRNALAVRPRPKKDEDADLVFVTRCGASWSRDTSDAPVTLEFRKLLKALAIDGRKGLGFYTLRHVFRTVADETKDSVACDAVMGHETPHMSSAYRETISDARLRAVTDHVRAWLFAESEAAADNGPGTNDEEE